MVEENIQLKISVMLILTCLSLGFIVIMGAVMFVENKIVDDLPDNNSFKEWWRKHIIAEDKEGLW